MAKMTPKKKTTKDDGFAATVAAIEEENRAKMSNAIVSEDGIVYDEPLLAGYMDENGTLHTTFSYRETTGRDEEAINKPEIKNNPGRILTTVVERCVLSIGTLEKKEVGEVAWKKIVRELFVGDLNYMVFKIRELSRGGVITFRHKCPNCRHVMVTEADTDEFERVPFNGQYETPFSLRRGVLGQDGQYHTEGFVRPMNGQDGELVLPALRKNAASGMTTLMTRLMKFNDEGNGFSLTNNMVANMTSSDRGIITDIISESAFGVKLTLEITCENCGEYLADEVGVSDFFA